MEARHNHTSIAALTNMQQLLLLHCIDSFSLSRARYHTGTTSNRSWSSQTLWHLRVQSHGIPFPLYSVMFLVCPLQRPHGATQHMSPLRAVSPGLPQGLSRDIPCRDAGLWFPLHSWWSTGRKRTGKKNGWKLSLSGQNCVWQKWGTQKMLLFWGKHLRLSHLVRHWSLSALQWIHAPAWIHWFSRTGS